MSDSDDLGYLWRAADAVQTALDAGDDRAGDLFSDLLAAVGRELEKRAPAAATVEAELLVARAVRLGERVLVRKLPP